MKYRAEIDGLRALAVLPVIFFHAGFELFSGGFVGVDVFFVISGYLITTIIISEMDEGNFNLLNFYERRARRILPALFFVMAVCIPFAWMWMAPNDLKDFGQSLFAVSTFSSNILFWLESGYFDTAAELKPLLHTWSLAVEEQYYIIFPIFLILTWKFGIKWILFLLSLIFLLSLGLSQWAVKNNLADSLFLNNADGWNLFMGALKNPSSSFYLLPTRAWELLVGVFIAFFLKYKAPLKIHSANQLLSLAGFSMIVYSIIIFDKGTPFPSVYTLIPTIGTGLLILCATPKTIIHKFLSFKLIVSIGLISYSAYLWHQPLLAFARHRLLGEVPDILLLFLCITSIVMAWMSWRFVEKPFRDKNIFSRKNIFTFSLSCIFLFSLIGISLNYFKGFSDRTNLSSELLSSFKNSYPSCKEISMKNPSKKIGCKIGADKEKIDFILFGDSHVIPLINLVDYLANQEDLSVVYISAGGCLPFLETYLLREDRAITDCANINKNVYQFSNDNNIKGIILAARWSFYTHGDYNLRGGYFVSNDADGPFNFDETINNGFEKGFNKTIDMYNASGIPVHILTQPPHQKYSPMSVYFLASKGLGSINTLSVTKAEFMELNKIPMSVFETRGDDINLYDVTNIYCTKILCPIGTSEKSFYNDENHLSDEGALRLKNVLYSVFLSNP